MNFDTFLYAAIALTTALATSPIPASVPHVDYIRWVSGLTAATLVAIKAKRSPGVNPDKAANPAAQPKAGARNENE